MNIASGLQPKCPGSPTKDKAIRGKFRKTQSEAADCSPASGSHSPVPSNVSGDFAAIGRAVPSALKPIKNKVVGVDEESCC